MGRFIFSAEEIAKICDGEIIGNPKVLVDDFSINSKSISERTLFIPIIGEKVDAHIFLEDLEKEGLKLSLVSREIKELKTTTQIKVKDTLKAIQKLAEYAREKIKFPIITVTGSVGKTSTRRMLANIFSAQYKVYQTKGNQNSQIGVPLTILNMPKEDFDFAILELGISEIGEMEKLAKIVKADACIITNIAPAHLENLFSIENIAKEKLKITKYMNKNSLLVLNVKYKDLIDSVLENEIEKINVCMSDDSKYNYRLLDYQKSTGGSRFSANINNNIVTCEIKDVGIHQVENTLLCLSLAHLYSIDLKKAIDKLKDFSNIEHRQDFIYKDELLVIDDAYNASPLSMKASIDVLKEVGDERKKVLVIGDMKELGENSYKYHKELGEYILDTEEIASVYLYGNEVKAIYEVLNTKKEVKYFTERDLLLKELKEEIKKRKDLVLLFKASNSMKLFDIAKEILS